MKEKFESIKSKLICGGAVGAVSALAVAVPSFAAEGDFTITASMLSPVTTAINSGLTTILPIGLQIMGWMVGIYLIPRLIWKFL